MCGIVGYVGTDRRVGEADLLAQLAPQRIEMILAVFQAATRGGPHGAGRELEAHQQDLLGGCEQQPAHRPADPELSHVPPQSQGKRAKSTRVREQNRLRQSLGSPDSVVFGRSAQSFGVSCKPSLNALYIS